MIDLSKLMVMLLGLYPRVLAAAVAVSQIADRSLSSHG